MRFPSPALIHYLLIVLLACSGDSVTEDVTGSWVAETAERGDTTVVRTVGGSVWGDTMTLVPDVAIGEFEGPTEAVFGRIAGLDVFPDGRIVVSDAQAHEVRIFSPEGQLLRQFGGEGDGPGEFRGPDHLRVTGDRIVVRDNNAHRFSVFTSDGEYLGGWSLNSGFVTSAPFYLDEQSNVVNPTLRDRLVRYQLDGTVVDTTAIPTRGHDPPQLEARFEGGVVTYSIPFMPNEVWAMTRSGEILFGLSDRYLVERWSEGGRVLQIERVAEPVPVAGAEAEQLHQGLLRRLRRQVPDWQWDGPDIPSSKPVFRETRAGIDGTIWIFRETPSLEERNPDWDPQNAQSGFPTRWVRPVVADVFSADGAFLGPVEIPRHLNWFYPPAVLSQDQVWSVATHEMGYPQVVRFRIEPK